MTALSADATENLADSGYTPTQWSRIHFSDGKFADVGEIEATRLTREPFETGAAAGRST
ncbi:hypothetical protein ACFQ9V_10480 [Leifsonia sp. NPDC056665]|uniref:hypothetical protein n=1 Tax=Leifsonia sp. NPDC056665 TaxID=3345901 RepID=UPI0036A07B4C